MCSDKLSPKDFNLVFNVFNPLISMEHCCPQNNTFKSQNMSHICIFNSLVLRLKNKISEINTIVYLAQYTQILIFQVIQ